MTQNIPISRIKPNSGQIEGLPANPRFINEEKFQKLKKSLQDDPEMLELREILVFRWGEEYVIIGGNMRFRAAVDLDQIHTISTTIYTTNRTLKQPML